MLRSYILTAVRHMRKHKLYTLINVAGLSIGFTCFILIMMYTSHELSFDRFHQYSASIVKVNLEFGDSPDVSHPVSTTPNALLPAVASRFPEVVNGTRYFNPSSFRPPVVQHGDRIFHEEGFAYADSSFFDVFSFPLVTGAAETALALPNSVILTRSAALKYFGKEEVQGEQLVIGGSNFTVTGLMEDIPDNSHIRFTMLGSFASHPASRNEVWGSANYFTYLRLSDASARDQLRPKIQALFTEVEYDQPDRGFYVTPVLVPLEDLYLHSAADALSDPSYSLIFSIIGLLILAIACVNYMNLATARSAMRSREVGIRKVSGAYKGQLVGQFMAEAFVITFMAFIMSLLLVWLALPYFNQVSGKALPFSYFFMPGIAGITFSVVVLVAIGSGVYPAIVLSSFRPAAVLKGQGPGAMKGALLRRVLVVGQFAVSIFLVIATLVVEEQMRFVREKDLGYSGDAIISVQVNRTLVQSSDAVKNTLLASGNAAKLAFAGESPTEINGGYSIWGQGMDTENAISINAVAVDEDFSDVMNIDLVAGSFISKSDLLRAREEEPYYSFVLNETAVTSLGWDSGDAIGKRVSMNGRSGEVKGVIKDFHFSSLHQPIGPLALFPETDWAYNCLLVKINGDLGVALDGLSNDWKSVISDYPFQYSFLDDELGRMYASEKRLDLLFRVFSSIALIIACLGLFGMASYVTLQRTKEFGVRKVLGASAGDIVQLVSGQFAILVFIAFLVAAPVAYFIMERWLEDFVYRMNMNVLHFMVALGGAMIIALLTISFHAFRSATTNPAEVLKRE